MYTIFAAGVEAFVGASWARKGECGVSQGAWDFSSPFAWMEHTSKMPPLVVTVAVNGGIQGKESHPALPELPAEIAAETQRAYEAGASAVHIHGRDLSNVTNCTCEAEVYREINGLVREKCPEIIINNTTGGGPTVTDEARIACLGAMPEMATLNLGPDMERFVLAERRPPLLHPREAVEVDLCMPFTYGFIDCLATEMRDKGIKPELEVYQPGQFWVSRGLAERGLIDPPYCHQFVLGVQTGSYPTPWSVLALLQDLPGESLFTVAATGKFQWPLVTLALILGGNVRVGLEDNLYERRGRKLNSNAEAIEKITRIAREFGRAIATPAEAREMWGLPPTPSTY